MKVLISLLWLLSWPIQAQWLQAQVVRVPDGDSVEVLINQVMYRARLEGIDAPELHQSFGPEAKQFLQKNILNRWVYIETQNKDKYDRLLAKVYVGNTDMNREMIRWGYAWFYPPPRRQPLNAWQRDYAVMEQQARRSRIGLWAAASQPVRPSQWRREHPR